MQDPFLTRWDVTFGSFRGEGTVAVWTWFVVTVVGARRGSKLLRWIPSLVLDGGRLLCISQGLNEVFMLLAPVTIVSLM